MWELLESNSAGINRTIQTLPDFLRPFMHGASALGVELFYLALVPIVFWGLSRKSGVHLLLLVLASAYTNTLFKWLFSRPRPDWISADVAGLDVEHSFGIPSGHSQNAVVVWFFMAGLLAVHGRRTLWYSVAACIVLLISFSRLYLGVHFLQDLACGWLLGGLILLANHFVSGRIPAGGKSAAWMLAIPALLVGIGYLARSTAVPAWPAYDVLDTGVMLNTTGTLLALLIVYVLSERILIKEDSLSMGARLGLILITFVLVFGVRAGLSVLFQKIEFAPDLVRFVRYVLVGLVGFYAVPLLAARFFYKEK